MFLESGCIVMLIKLFLDKLTNRDQAWFIKGGFIGENVRLIFAVIYTVYRL